MRSAATWLSGNPHSGGISYKVSNLGQANEHFHVQFHLENDNNNMRIGERIKLVDIIKTS